MVLDQVSTKSIRVDMDLISGNIQTWLINVISVGKATRSSSAVKSNVPGPGSYQTINVTFPGFLSILNV